MSLSKIFKINLVIGIIVCLSHIPIVVLKLYGISNFETVNLWLVVPMIPFDLILLIGSIAALLGSEKRRLKVLFIHAVILSAFSVLLLGMLLWFIIIGFPEGNFSWSAGLGAAFAGYTVHVAKRAFYNGNNKFMKNAGWYAAGVVFLLELVLMYKFYVVHFT